MCYEIVFAMLTTYENGYYPDEDSLVKRRKTSKADSSRAKEQTYQTTGSNVMMRSNKPLLAVRNLEGDRLSKPKYPSENSVQHGGVIRREANNPYFAPGYSIPDPRFMFGVRDVRNVWPGRMPIPNAPFRHEYRPSTIARPYPLRMRPVYSSFPSQLSHTGWIRTSVTSAFTPVRNPTGSNKPLWAVRNWDSDRLSEPELQTAIVTTQSVMIPHSSSIQSLRDMLRSVTATTSTSSSQPLSASRSLSPVRITSSESRTFKPAAQPNTTTRLSPVQPQESPKSQPPHIPAQTIMVSPSSSLHQSSCSVTTTSVTTEQPFSTTRIMSTGSSTSQTSIVTTQPHLSSIQSLSSMVDSISTSTTPPLAEDLSINSGFNTARVISSGSSKAQDVNPIAQPITTTPSCSIQSQPSHIPVQTIVYSPPCSRRAPSQTQNSETSLCSVTTNTTTTVTTSSAQKHSASRKCTTRIVSSRSSKSRASKRKLRPIKPAPRPTILPKGSSKFKPSHIPVQTIMYSPSCSRRAASQTAVVTTSSAKEHSANSAFSTSRIMSSTSQTSIVTTQGVMAADSSSIQSPSSMVGSVTASTIVLSAEDLSFNSAVTPNQVTAQSENSNLATQSITTVPSAQPPISSNSQTSKLTAHLLLLSSSPSLQSSESLTSQISKATTQPNNVAPPSSSSLQSSGSTTTQSSKLTTHLLLLSTTKASTTQASNPTQPVTVASSSSESKTAPAPKITTHLLLLSPPTSRQSSEPSQTQNSSLAKLLLLSPPMSQIVCTATTPTTTSPAVVSSSIGGESSSEAALDGEETIFQSVVGTIKVNIPRTSKASRSIRGEGLSEVALDGEETVNQSVADTVKPARRQKENEIEEKDALLQRMYSVPAFGGRTVKGSRFYDKMLTKPKLCHLFKCMASDCSFTCNQKTLFDEHILMHESKHKTQKGSPRRDSLEEDDELNDWQQCAYCCESPTYPTTSLSEHLITEHGYCEYQCAYCFYRALFQNYVDIHQTLAHRKILKNNPRVIYRCKVFSEGPTVATALKKVGRRRCVRPYHCDQCGSEFLITEDFMNHLLKEHQSVTSYTCHICKNVCFKPDRLVVHYKLHAYSTYQCAYCLHGTETERKMIFHLCTFHFAQPACLYVRAWDEGKQVQSEDKSKKQKNKTKSVTNELECLKMIAYDIEATKGESTLEEASDEDSGDERLVIDDSQELNDIIAELGITTETESNEAIPLMRELASIGNSTSQNLPVSALLPNAKFSLESETGEETVLISSGSSSNSSSI